MEQKTKLEIIDEIANFYNLNNRAINNINRCEYYIDGKTCAVGRYLIKPEEIEDKGSYAEELLKNNDNLFKPEYRGHSIQFWVKMQCFHDDENNFTHTGLSEKGVNNINKLKKQWVI